MDPDWSVYIVRCADQTLYTGIAKNIVQRIAQHNAGNGAAYTRARRPVVLVHQEPAPDRGAALRREAAIKRLPVAAKRALAGG
jgi:putative endonuclease